MNGDELLKPYGDEFDNINVYPLVADILGLKIDEKIDGKLKVLKSTLKR